MVEYPTVFNDTDKEKQTHMFSATELDCTPTYETSERKLFAQAFYTNNTFVKHVILKHIIFFKLVIFFKFY